MFIILCTHTPCPPPSLAGKSHMYTDSYTLVATYPHHQGQMLLREIQNLASNALLQIHATLNTRNAEYTFPSKSLLLQELLQSPSKLTTVNLIPDLVELAIT